MRELRKFYATLHVVDIVMCGRTQSTIAAIRSSKSDEEYEATEDKRIWGVTFAEWAVGGVKGRAARDRRLVGRWVVPLIQSPPGSVHIHAEFRRRRLRGSRDADSDGGDWARRGDDVKHAAWKLKCRCWPSRSSHGVCYSVLALLSPSVSGSTSMTTRRPSQSQSIYQTRFYWRLTRPKEARCRRMNYDSVSSEFLYIFHDIETIARKRKVM